MRHCAPRIHMKVALLNPASQPLALPFRQRPDLKSHCVLICSTASNVLLELEVGVSMVTTLLAYLSPCRTDYLLFTGHADGSIAAHRLTESSLQGDNWLSLITKSSCLIVRGLDASLMLPLEAHHIGRFLVLLASNGGDLLRPLPASCFFGLGVGEEVGSLLYGDGLCLIVNADGLDLWKLMALTCHWLSIDGVDLWKARSLVLVLLPLVFVAFKSFLLVFHCVHSNP